MDKLEDLSYEEYEVNDGGYIEGKYKTWYCHIIKKYDMYQNYVGYEKIRGTVKVKCFYKNGVLHGKYEEFGRDGRVRVKCEYVDGEIVGKFYSVENNLLEYYESGEGVHKEFHSNGRVSVVFDCDEKKTTPNGSYKEYFSDGTLKKSCGYSKDGVMMGPFEEFYDSGKVRRCCCYQEGVLHGAYFEHSWTGLKMIACGYSKGLLHGKYEEWYDEPHTFGDTRKVVMNFINGCPFGEYKRWNYRGGIEFEWEYEGGDSFRRKNCRGYNEDGKVVVEWSDLVDGYSIIPNKKYISQITSERWFWEYFDNHRNEDSSYADEPECELFHRVIGDAYKKMKNKIDSGISFVDVLCDRFKKSVLLDENIIEVWAPCLVKKFIFPDIAAYMLISIEKDAVKTLLGFNSKGLIVSGIACGVVKKIVDDEGKSYSTASIKIVKDYVLPHRIECCVGDIISHKRGGIPVFKNKEMCYSWLIVP
ncbi:MAG: hypothetical protein Harvfovirus1_79 [Harvfovirus sp.]|uniref:MORN repeat-containing protein n=1 Tax=Harvfovirus sp. TaxID=2487768 RepID=A0A3G5A1S3_9VIRU|nr:MAG: hypothetical protein Harvfovirus1_79 [Harvfovirus sp.]